MDPATNDGPVYTVTLATGETFGPVPLKTIAQWVQEGRVPPSATLSTSDGSPPINVTSVPKLNALLADTGQGDEPFATIVPYRNPHALVGYYISILSLLPFIGGIAGPTAIVLGIIGLKKRKIEPQRKGTGSRMDRDLTRRHWHTHFRKLRRRHHSGDAR